MKAQIILRKEKTFKLINYLKTKTQIASESTKTNKTN